MQNEDEITLDLLKENYQNLHQAFWECHKIYWQMTSIFLPLVLAIMGLVLKDMFIPPTHNGKISLIIFFVCTLLLLTFWFLTTEYLDSWNETRRKRLKEIEKHINHLKFDNQRVEDFNHLDLFNQYHLPYKLGFHKLTRLLYAFLFIGILITMHLRLLT